MKKYFLLLILLIPFGVLAKGYEIVSGDLDTPLSVVKIADEEFYVLSKEDDTHVRLLSKLNLGVGEGVSTQVNRQSTESGVVPFSTTNYWWDETTSDFKSPYLERKVILGRDNMDDKAYVYDENSTVYSYVNDYVDYLNTQGVCVTGELARRRDVQALGCNDACVRCHSFTYYCITDHDDIIYGESPWWVGDAPIFQLYEETNPFETAPGYFATGNHYYFNSAPVVRVARYEAEKKQAIRPVITLDLSNTCIKEEPPKEEVKGETEEVKENPKTGRFYSGALIAVLASAFMIFYIRIMNKSAFK